MAIYGHDPTIYEHNNMAINNPFWPQCQMIGEDSPGHNYFYKIGQTYWYVSVYLFDGVSHIIMKIVWQWQLNPKSNTWQSLAWP